MAEPFEFISRGMDLAAQGKFTDAEKYIQRGIKEYEKRKDADGVTFALGRLGNCYEQAEEVDKAEAAYEKAVQLGTDIPAIYSGLIGILVLKNKFDRAFQIADIWQAKGAQHISYPAHQIFLGLSGNVARQGQYQDAKNLLDRTIQVLPKQKYPELFWSARGHLGQVYEQSGDLDSAMQHYQRAISEGSTDRNTYTRYLINLEKMKNYNDALQVIQKGLKAQKDAAWEADLRKREQRLMKKTGAIPKGAPQKIIPDFAIRKGEKSVSLLQQIQYSPQLSASIHVENRIYGITGGKSPKLVAHDLGSEAHAWQIELPQSVDGILATNENIILYARDGSVGNGKTLLLFYKLDGNFITQQHLPDVPSEVVIGGENVYVGCRNGNLYAFSTNGKALWCYKVPGSEKVPESPYFRPCPYYVSAGDEIVAFSSFENLFVLNSNGKLLYLWSTPEQKSVTRSELFTMTISTGPSAIRALGVAKTGKRVIVATDRGIFEIIDGRIVHFVKSKTDVVHSIAISPSDNLWGISVADKLLIFKDGKQTGSIPLKGYGQIRFNHEANRIIGWSGKNLSVATYSGTLIGEIEFVKDIHFAECLDDGKLIIATRYIIYLDTIPKPNGDSSLLPEPETEKEQPIKQRAKDEAGIPINWIVAKKISVGPGKSIFQVPNGKEYTIEQIALEYYRSSGYKGTWTENTYWWEIMALLFWDVIYAKIPGVFTPQFGDFPGKMQDMPQDFFNLEFYTRRNGLIEKRIQSFSSPKFFGLVKTSIEDELRTAYKRHYGKPCRPIEDWKRYPLETLLFSLKTLTRDQILLIMRRLLENLNENRRGLPDLFIVDSSGKAKFVEVKAEKEKITDQQISWMRFLQDQAGIRVEICRVISQGA
jgi:tetratricopeptide (TPR) repeat protein